MLWGTVVCTGASPPLHGRTWSPNCISQAPGAVQVLPVRHMAMGDGGSGSHRGQDPHPIAGWQMSKPSKQDVLGAGFHPSALESVVMAAVGRSIQWPDSWRTVLEPD